jgi:hypothetical protein
VPVDFSSVIVLYKFEPAYIVLAAINAAVPALAKTSKFVA